VAADTALLRAARGGRAAGRLGRTGVVGGNLRGAATAAMRRVREDLSDDLEGGERRGEETGEIGSVGIFMSTVWLDDGMGRRLSRVSLETAFL
jgi:hypothetical protein